MLTDDPQTNQGGGNGGGSNGGQSQGGGSQGGSTIQENGGSAPAPRDGSDYVVRSEP